MTPELSLAYADIARLTERVRELEAALVNMLAVPRDHMSACNKTMGDSHSCTCGANDARALMAKPGFHD